VVKTEYQKNIVVVADLINSNSRDCKHALSIELLLAAKSNVSGLVAGGRASGGIPRK